MKKIFLTLFLLLSFTTVAYASDAPVKNAGFVQANIWYSKEPFFAGETVRIYTVIFNGSTQDLSGSVEFMDNGTSIAKAPFNLLGSGKALPVSVRWKAMEGKHTITARIVDASTSLYGGAKTPIVLENAEGVASVQTVELDPAVKEAQAKADATKAVETVTPIVGKVEGAIQTVTNSIPVPIKEGTTASANAAEDFRTTIENQLRVAKENKGKQLDIINARTASTTAKIDVANKKAGILSTVSGYTEKPFAYIMFGLLAFLQYFFAWRIIFYGVIFYILYRLIKWGIQKIRNR